MISVELASPPPPQALRPMCETIVCGDFVRAESASQSIENMGVVYVQMRASQQFGRCSRTSLSFCMRFFKLTSVASVISGWENPSKY